MNNSAPIGKYLIFVIPGAIIVIALIYFLLNAKSGTQQVTENPSQVTPIPQAAGTNQLKSTTVGSVPNGVEYKTNKYTITYPSTWQPTSLAFNGGQSAMIRPQGAKGDPIFVVESYDAAQDVAQKQALYLAEGCVKSTIVINNDHLAKLSCVFPVRTIDGKKQFVTTQQEMVYIPRPEALYVIRFYYTAQQRDPGYETLFTQMLSSLQILQ